MDEKEQIRGVCWECSMKMLLFRKRVSPQRKRLLLRANTSLRSHQKPKPAHPATSSFPKLNQVGAILSVQIILVQLRGGCYPVLVILSAIKTHDLHYHLKLGGCLGTKRT